MKKQKLSKIMNSYLFDVHNDHRGGRIGILMIYIVFYIVLESILFRSKTSHIQGIVGQILLIMSVYLVTRIPKIGFRVVLFFNILQLIAILLAFFRLQDESILPGIFVTLSALIVAWIIHRFHRKLSEKYYEIQQQKNAYMNIYEDLARNERKLESLTLIDNTTAIGNRKMMVDAIERLKSNEEIPSFAVALIDLDDFKAINDRHGHAQGDVLLLEIATRLKNTIEKKDLLARFGGDEFAVFIHDLKSEEELLSYLERLKESINVKASFGVTRYPKDTKHIDKILKFAETALNKAKEKGKDQIVFFNEEMEIELNEKSLFEE
ncbi:MAG: diguanylate cyclase, partial [Vallitaleaceae bacterium]|nr:diguanylate cyclase [Vallitaleaceae bacterium]